MHLVLSGVIRPWFSWVTQSRLKIIGESPHEWTKLVIPCNFISYILLVVQWWINADSLRSIAASVVLISFVDRNIRGHLAISHANHCINKCSTHLIIIWNTLGYIYTYRHMLAPVRGTVVVAIETQVWLYWTRFDFILWDSSLCPIMKY